MKVRLSALGWTDNLEAAAKKHLDEGLVPGRISREHRRGYDILTDKGPARAKLVGRLQRKKKARELDCCPAVGDWVLVKLQEAKGTALIFHVLPRRSVFIRKAPGRHLDAQVLAANIDVVFLISAVGELNPRRIERFLALASTSGAEPVVVLNKIDAVDREELAEKIERIRPIVGDHPIFAVSARTREGMEGLDPYLERGRTIALLGASGVGKSTVLNLLFEEEIQKVAEVRTYDGKGRHTTSARHLVELPRGGIIIDTPGIRELQPWGADLEGAFQDIHELGEECRFRNCAHEEEPGCRVKAAVEANDLEKARFESYQKLRREADALEETLRSLKNRALHRSLGSR